MKKKMNKWLGMCVICGSVLAIGSIVKAETVYLKSGEKITGKIIAQSTKLIMVECDDGVYRSYSPDEIQENKKADIVAQPVAKTETKQNITDNSGKKSEESSKQVLKKEPPVSRSESNNAPQKTIQAPAIALKPPAKVEIKKEVVAKKPAVQVTIDKKVTTGGNKTIVQLKETVFKIALPEGYVLKDKSYVSDSRSAISFVKKENKNNPGESKVLATIGMNGFSVGGEYLKNGVCDDRELQIKWLGTVKASITRSGGKWLTENSELFGHPAIVMTHMTAENKLAATCFVLGNKWYKLDFTCKKENFDKEWPAVEQSFKSMERQEVSGAK